MFANHITNALQKRTEFYISLASYSMHKLQQEVRSCVLIGIDEDTFYLSIPVVYNC